MRLMRGRSEEVLVGRGSRARGRSTGGHLGEEAVAADVEAPAVALDGAADAADDVVGLEHRGRLALLGEHGRRR